MDTFLFYFILFIFYSFCGWIIEEVVCSMSAKKIVNRGFLIGPYCPIYGYAAIFMTFMLNEYKSNVITLFTLSSVLCTVMEYITSYAMEKLFHARWWDYSCKSFNINGRVCLVNSIYFGILGCLLIYFINPFFCELLGNLSLFTIRLLGFALLVLFLFDNIISFTVVFKLKFAADSVYKDSTEEISEKIREIISKKSFLYKRLLDAFPNMRAILKEKKEKIEKYIDEREVKLKASIDKKQEQVKATIKNKKEKFNKSINTKKKEFH